jgi:hypothetical protein
MCGATMLDMADGMVIGAGIDVMFDILIMV